MIYKMIKTMIEDGNYDKKDILKKMDVFLLSNRISEEQYNTLLEIMGE